MRNIPSTMATQHPDNASAPYWSKYRSAFISAPEEISESVICFKDLGVSEYMWDWEGKNADAAVIDRLFSEYYDYFKRNILGKDKFLTFRIPNIWEEKGYNLLQAMTVILSSEDFARDLKLANKPLFEVILPMTERAEQVIHMQKLFDKLAKFKSLDFTPDRLPNDTYLELIPLIESVESQLNVKQLLYNYLKLHDANFAFRPKYLRVFLACSDSALSSGHIASVLGNKLGLARLYEFSKSSKLPIFPILGPGSLAFRGGLSPDSIDRFMSEYPGVRTVTIQSSFRYDNIEAKVKAAIKKLEDKLPKLKPLSFTPKEQSLLEEVIEISSEFYGSTINKIIPDLNKIFASVPKRRERRQHIGLLAYGRKLGTVELPRAITFTAGFYSIGIPPEFIGAGRTLNKLSKSQSNVLFSTYKSMKDNFVAAGKYLNHDNLSALTKNNKGWQEIRQDIDYLEQILNVKFGPTTNNEKMHIELSGKLLKSKSGSESTKLIEQMAVIRGSLG